MRFSEVPRFLLEEFFNISLPVTPPPSGDYPFVSGLNLDSEIGAYFELVIDTVGSEDPRINFVPFYAYPPVYANDFFYVQRATSLETSATSALVIGEYAEAYLVKSPTYEQYRYDLDTGGRYKANLFDRLIRYKSVEQRSYLDYTNINKPFLYIGRIYPETDVPEIYRIEYWGIDRYATNCLPPHLQTIRMKEFLNIYFDKVYNRVYNKERGVITLVDALEVDLNFISYLSETYQEPISKEYIDNLSNDLYSVATRKMERRLRENVRELPNFLKRKGSYSSIYGVFQNFFWASSDSIAVYERWHSKDICNGWPGISTAIPHSPKGHFIDFNYLNFYQHYKSTLTTCVSAGHDVLVNAGGYPVPLTDCFIHQEQRPKHIWFIVHKLGTNAPIIQCYDDDLKIMTPYKVMSTTKDITIIEFDTNRSGTAVIIKPDALTAISFAPESFMFSHGLDSVAPIVDGGKPSTFTYNTFSIPVTASLSFDAVLPRGVNDVSITSSTTVGQEVYAAAVDEDYIFEQESPSATWWITHPLDSKAIIADMYVSESSDTWDITHSLGTSAIIAQAVDNDNKLIAGAVIQIVSDSEIMVNLLAPAEGKLLIKIADDGLPLSAGDHWDLIRAFSTYTPISQTFDGNNINVDTEHLEERPQTNHETQIVSLDGEISGHHNYKIPDYVQSYIIKRDHWTVTHELSATEVIANFYVGIEGNNFTFSNPLSSTDIIVQCYNSDRELIVPDTLSITTTEVSAHFDEATEAYFVIGPETQTDLIWSYTQTEAASGWWVEHYLDNFNTLIFVQDNNGNPLTTTRIQQYSKDWYRVEFSSPQTGRVIIRVVDDLVMAVKKADPQALTILDENRLLAHFNTAEMGYAAVVIADVAAREVFKVEPLTFEIIDESTCKATFSSFRSGLASLKEIGKLTYAEGLIQSPHYKVEIDVNCEPLCEPNIIEKSIALQLIHNWEDARPASKYAHYSILIAPKTDFTGVKRDMYDERFLNTKVYTFCTIDTSVAVPGETYRYCQYDPLYDWVIYHNLNSYDLLVQCYDVDLNLIYPTQVELKTPNMMIIHWSEPQGGFAFIAKAEVTFTDTEATTAIGTWTMSTASLPPTAAEDALSDYYFYKYPRSQLVPSNVEITYNSVIGMWYVPTLGYCNIRPHDYLHVQSTPATVWNITHNLAHIGVIVQCYDNNRNMLVSEHLQLDKYDKKCAVTFSEAVSGYAIITDVGATHTPQGVIDSIAAGGYIKVGGVADPDKWPAKERRDVKDPSPYITTKKLRVAEDDTHYYVEGEIEDEYTSKIVTEMGLFTAEDELVFYGYVKPPSQLYKTEEMDLDILFRILKP